ncbi:hypothetical protein DBV05_g11575 [Lasiodiplodia theobromae]|uniref:Uncharacterized protein n=1 Tax=Lasiodiplodia theobromae TaxID=45133 RepID=A0A5N5CWS5_9PEZI|nr:hypothetical protein DBV05_g11575 [Lasiodiplodia theobromae]
MENPAKRRRTDRGQSRIHAADRAANGFGRMQIMKETVVECSPTPTPAPHIDEPLLLRERRGDHRKLGLRHRLIHRQEIDPDEASVTIVTVVRQIDQNGSTVGVRTMSSVVAASSAGLPILSTPTSSSTSSEPLTTTASFPQVPSVPAFPSDLTVPSVPPYPFNSQSTPPHIVFIHCNTADADLFYLDITEHAVVIVFFLGCSQHADLFPFGTGWHADFFFASR